MPDPRSQAREAGSTDDVSRTDEGALTGPEGAAGAADPSGPSPGWTRADTVRTTVALVIALALSGAAWWVYQENDRGGPTASFALLAGTALGILFERGRFCFYCIFRDLFEKGDSRGVYAILTALAVGSTGYAFVFTIRMSDPTGDQLPTAAHIAPVSLALVVAGLAFGLGVALSGGCIAGHLYRLGEGSLRALPGLAGVLGGFGLGFLTWNPVYLGFISGAPSPWLPSALGYTGALVLQLGLLAGVALLLLRWNPPLPARHGGRFGLGELRRRVFFERWPALLTGALVGLVGVVAYLRSEPLGVTSQLSSLARTALDSQDALPHTLYGLDTTLAGCVALVVETVTDNGWLVIGIVAGSLAAALPGRRFSLEPLTWRNGSTALLGGVMLGWGSITALGCTVGVFLSGTQAFAVSGWVFAASVVGGLALGFRAGVHRS